MDLNKINNIIDKHKRAAAEEIASIAFNGVNGASHANGASTNGAALATPVAAPVKARKNAKKSAKQAKAAKAAFAKSAAKAPKAAKPAKVKSAKKGPGEKRDPAVLEALVEKLHEHIKANPGQRIEAIATALGCATRELNLPAKKLFKAKRITKKGEKRATTYFAK